jgi:tetratricopeptide (TPR) repeat protein
MRRRNATLARTVLRSLVIVVLFCVAATAAAAQQIQGEVRSAQTGQPIFNILVHCEGTGGNNQVQTDRSGKFYFRVSPGHYNVYIHVPGYRDEQQSLDLTDVGASEYVFFRLKEDPAHPLAAAGGSPNAADANVPAPARAEFDKGSALIDGGQKEKLAEGIGYLEKAVSLYPNYLQAELMLGAAYMELKQWDKAEKSFKHALAIAPATANADFALGELYLQQKKYADAEKALQEGLKLEDRSYQGHYTLGRVYWAQNDIVKAGPEIGKTLQLKARQAENALAEFEEYLRLAPNGEFAPPTRDLVTKIKDALAKSKRP